MAVPFDLDLSQFADDTNLLSTAQGHNPRPFLRATVNPTQLGAVLKFLYPTFIEYRQSVFFEFSFVKVAVDDWFQRFENSTAVEEVVNHVHLWDVLSPSENFEAEADLLLDPIRVAWCSALRTSLPRKSFHVQANPGGDYGPELTFWSIR